MKQQDIRDTLASVLGGKKRKRPSGYRSVKDGDLINPIQLDEFLEGVGGILRMPAKDIAPPPKPKAAFSLPKHWLTIGVSVVALAVVGLVVNRPVAPEGTATLPPQVIGRWVTTDKRYQNRSFEITPGFVAFKNGDRKDDQTVHQVTGVRTAVKADTTMITLEYLEAEGTYSLAIKYLPRPKPSIIFTNQEELVWNKATPR